MSQPAIKKPVYRRGSPLPRELKTLTDRVEELETKVKEMHETLYGHYGLQGAVRRLDSGGGER